MARVCIGCGLTLDDGGNLIANVGDHTFPNGCDSSLGGNMFCTAAGEIRSLPATQVQTTRTFENNIYSPHIPLTTGFVTYETTANATVNPSDCCDALLTRYFEIDVEFTIEPGERIEIRFAGDGYIGYENKTFQEEGHIHWQFHRSSSQIVGPGVADLGSATIQVAEPTGGGSTFLDRIQWSVISEYVTACG